jgi:hypothetical protein
MSAAKAGIAVSPSRTLASWARAFTRRGVKKGRKILAEYSAPMRVMAAAAAPFSKLELVVGEKSLTLEAVPWMAWFRSSIYWRALSTSDLVELSRRFSCKVRLRVIVPPGPPLPMALYPGVASDASGEVLEWLIGRYL